MIYIGTDEGIYRWRHGVPWPVFHSLQDRAIVDLASPGGGMIVAVDGLGWLLETVDNGQSWREVILPEGAGRPTALTLLGSPSEVVVATRYDGLHRRPVGLDPSARGAGRLSRAEQRAASLIGRAWSRATWRGERGATAIAEPPPRPAAEAERWARLATPAAEVVSTAPGVRALVAGDGALFAAVPGAGLWKSTDAGVSWSQCAGLPTEIFAIRTATKPAGMVAVATSDGVWISIDHGATWQDKSGGLEKARHVRALEIKPGDPNYLLAGAAPSAPGEGPVAPRGGLQFALYESQDGGKSWKHVVRGFPEVLEYDTIADIRFDPSDTDYAAVALASGEMWSTRSATLWWEPLARQIRTARVLCAVPA